MPQSENGLTVNVSYICRHRHSNALPDILRVLKGQYPYTEAISVCSRWWPVVNSTWTKWEGAVWACGSLTLQLKSFSFSLLKTAMNLLSCQYDTKVTDCPQSWVWWVWSETDQHILASLSDLARLCRDATMQACRVDSFSSVHTECLIGYRWLLARLSDNLKHVSPDNLRLLQVHGDDVAV